jgi:rhamnogalacturonan endolyase
MQVYHCLENGTTMVALHDAKDGSVIWKQEGSSTNDTGRCLVADIDPNSSGCEFWWAGSNAYSQSGSTDLGYKPGSCNMAIWFDGGLTRQLINENIINNDRAGGRTFTIYRYNETFINGTKSNPCWYGDFLGDWREEVILPSNDKLTDLKVFSTWYPTTYKLPYLMSDHTYFMQCIHEQVGYNQPTNVGGYYLGNGMDFTKVPLKEDPSTTGVKEVKTPQQQDSKETKVYDLSGRAVQQPRAGLYVRNGKKFVVR